MYVTIGHGVPVEPGETLASLEGYVQQFSTPALREIQAALETTREDKLHPFNANFPQGATLYAWEHIVRHELDRRSKPYLARPSLCAGWFE
jgi:hypothetical protein